MIKEKSCGAVVYRILGNEALFLGVKSKANGHWGFPKGHVEESESEIETAIREIKEETGLDVSITDDFRSSMEYSLSHEVTKEVVFFLARTSEEELSIQQEEIDEFVWLNFTDMMQKLSYDNAKDLLREANDFIKIRQI